jgi:hypothetical protein
VRAIIACAAYWRGCNDFGCVVGQPEVGRKRSSGTVGLGPHLEESRFLEADFWPASSRVCSGHNFRLARHSGITDRRALVRDLPIEGVDFLGAGVAEQKRRVVGGQAEPDIVETCLPEVLQVGHSLDLVIA